MTFAEVHVEDRLSLCLTFRPEPSNPSLGSFHLDFGLMENRYYRNKTIFCSLLWLHLKAKSLSQSL